MLENSGVLFLLSPEQCCRYRVIISIRTEEKNDSPKMAIRLRSEYPGPRKFREIWERRSEATYAATIENKAMKNLLVQDSR